MFEAVDPIAAFAARSKDAALLSVSASGGMFSELAKQVFAQKGVVYGAGWDVDSMTVIHKCAENMEQISEMRGSKYVQSNMTGVYSSVRTFLEEGRMVLFTGLPCQIAAMRKCFGDHQKLILCGIMCHSMSELCVWQKYVSELECKSRSRIAAVAFRDKRYGWRKSTMVVKFKDPAKDIAESLYENVYAKAYFSGYATKKSCLNCQFRSGRCAADLIIGDFWGVEDCRPELDDGKGVSAVLLFTAAGKDLFESCDVVKYELSYHQVVAKNPFLETSIRPNLTRRARFWKAYETKSIAGAIKYAEEGPLLVRALRFACRLPRRAIGKIVRILRVGDRGRLRVAMAGSRQKVDCVQRA